MHRVSVADEGHQAGGPTLMLVYPPQPRPSLEPGFEAPMRHLSGHGRVRLIRGLLKEQLRALAQDVTFTPDEPEPVL